MFQRPHVALLIDMSNLHGRRILHGVTRYLRAHRSWTIVLEQRDVDAEILRGLEQSRFDGVITRWGGPQVTEGLCRLGVPVVDVSSRRPPSQFPRITTDDHAAGRLAAEHLLERRFRSFAFYGMEHELWSMCRRDGFVETVSQAGHPVKILETPVHQTRRHPSEGEMARLARWLTALPKPAGVMVCKDLHGPYLIDACQRAGLRLPDEVAVIAVDDDELLCEMTDPPLSSVICNPDQIGFEAARALDRLIDGEEAGFDTMLIPPIGIATRLSSDVLAIDDARIVDAVRFIHANACHGITLSDVLDHVLISRTTLDRQFQRYLHRSPQDEICAVRFNRAKQLLAETDHPIHRVAELIGFKHAEYFHYAFKRAFGVTPGQFRKRSRSGRPTTPVAALAPAADEPLRRAGLEGLRY